jgi:hypothetical protein
MKPTITREIREAAGRSLWARLLNEPVELEPEPEAGEAERDDDAPEMELAA